MTGGQPVIHVAAALVTDAAGRALMVRKRGTDAFMQPGGKIEPGESALDTVRRELHEELGLLLPAERFAWLGTFEQDAANEPGRRVLAECFAVTLDEIDQVPVAAAEIEQSLWVDPASPGNLRLAPLSVHALLPLIGTGVIGTGAEKIEPSNMLDP